MSCLRRLSVDQNSSFGVLCHASEDCLLTRIQHSVCYVMPQKIVCWPEFIIRCVVSCLRRLPVDQNSTFGVLCHASDDCLLTRIQHSVCCVMPQKIVCWPEFNIRCVMSCLRRLSVDQNSSFGVLCHASEDCLLTRIQHSVCYVMPQKIVCWPEFNIRCVMSCLRRLSVDQNSTFGVLCHASEDCLLTRIQHSVCYVMPQKIVCWPEFNIRCVMSCLRRLSVDQNSTFGVLCHASEDCLLTRIQHSVCYVMPQKIVCWLEFNIRCYVMPQKIVCWPEFIIRCVMSCLRRLSIDQNSTFGVLCHASEDCLLTRIHHSVCCVMPQKIACWPEFNIRCVMSCLRRLSVDQNSSFGVLCHASEDCLLTRIQHSVCYVMPQKIVCWPEFIIRCVMSCLRRLSVDQNSSFGVLCHASEDWLLTRIHHSVCYVMPQKTVCWPEFNIRCVMSCLRRLSVDQNSSFGVLCHASEDCLLTRIQHSVCYVMPQKTVCWPEFNIRCVMSCLRRLSVDQNSTFGVLCHASEDCLLTRIQHSVCYVMPQKIVCWPEFNIRCVMSCLRRLSVDQNSTFGVLCHASEDCLLTRIQHSVCYVMPQKIVCWPEFIIRCVMSCLRRLSVDQNSTFGVLCHASEDCLLTRIHHSVCYVMPQKIVCWPEFIIRCVMSCLRRLSVDQNSTFGVLCHASEDCLLTRIHHSVCYVMPQKIVCWPEFNIRCVMSCLRRLSVDQNSSFGVLCHASEDCLLTRIQHSVCCVMPQKIVCWPEFNIRCVMSCLRRLSVDQNSTFGVLCHASEDCLLTRIQHSVCYVMPQKIVCWPEFNIRCVMSCLRRLSVDQNSTFGVLCHASEDCLLTRIQHSVCCYVMPQKIVCWPEFNIRCVVMSCLRRLSVDQNSTFGVLCHASEDCLLTRIHHSVCYVMPQKMPQKIVCWPEFNIRCVMSCLRRLSVDQNSTFGVLCHASEDCLLTRIHHSVCYVMLQKIVCWPEFNIRCVMSCLRRLSVDQNSTFGVLLCHASEDCLLTRIHHSVCYVMPQKCLLTRIQHSVCYVMPQKIVCWPEFNIRCVMSCLRRLSVDQNSTFGVLCHASVEDSVCYVSEDCLLTRIQHSVCYVMPQKIVSMFDQNSTFGVLCHASEDCLLTRIQHSVCYVMPQKIVCWPEFNIRCVMSCLRRLSVDQNSSFGVLCHASEDCLLTRIQHSVCYVMPQKTVCWPEFNIRCVMSCLRRLSVDQNSTFGVLCHASEDCLLTRIQHSVCYVMPQKIVCWPEFNIRCVMSCLRRLSVDQNSSFGVLCHASEDCLSQHSVCLTRIQHSVCYVMPQKIVCWPEFIIRCVMSCLRRLSVDQNSTFGVLCHASEDWIQHSVDQNSTFGVLCHASEDCLLTRIQNSSFGVLCHASEDCLLTRIQHSVCYVMPQKIVCWPEFNIRCVMSCLRRLSVDQNSTFGVLCHASEDCLLTRIQHSVCYVMPQKIVCWPEFIIRCVMSCLRRLAVDQNSSFGVLCHASEDCLLTRIQHSVCYVMPQKIVCWPEFIIRCVMSCLRRLAVDQNSTFGVLCHASEDCLLTRIHVIRCVVMSCLRRLSVDQNSSFGVLCHASEDCLLTRIQQNSTFGVLCHASEDCLLTRIHHSVCYVMHASEDCLLTRIQHSVCYVMPQKIVCWPEFNIRCVMSCLRRLSRCLTRIQNSSFGVLCHASEDCLLTRIQHSVCYVMPQKIVCWPEFIIRCVVSCLRRLPVDQNSTFGVLCHASEDCLRRLSVDQNSTFGVLCHASEDCLLTRIQHSVCYVMPQKIVCWPEFRIHHSVCYVMPQKIVCWPEFNIRCVMSCLRRLSVDQNSTFGVLCHASEDCLLTRIQHSVCYVMPQKIVCWPEFIIRCVMTRIQHSVCYVMPQKIVCWPEFIIRCVMSCLRRLAVDQNSTFGVLCHASEDCLLTRIQHSVCYVMPQKIVCWPEFNIRCVMSCLRRLSVDQNSTFGVLCHASEDCLLTRIQHSVCYVMPQKIVCWPEFNIRCVMSCLRRLSVDQNSSFGVLCHASEDCLLTRIQHSVCYVMPQKIVCWPEFNIRCVVSCLRRLSVDQNSTFGVLCHASEDCLLTRIQHSVCYVMPQKIVCWPEFIIRCVMSCLRRLSVDQNSTFGVLCHASEDACLLTRIQHSVCYVMPQKIVCWPEFNIRCVMSCLRRLSVDQNSTFGVLCHASEDCLLTRIHHSVCCYVMPQKIVCWPEFNIRCVMSCLRRLSVDQNSTFGVLLCHASEDCLLTRIQHSVCYSTFGVLSCLRRLSVDQNSTFGVLCHASEDCLLTRIQHSVCYVMPQKIVCWPEFNIRCVQHSVCCVMPQKIVCWPEFNIRCVVSCLRRLSIDQNSTFGVLCQAFLKYVLCLCPKANEIHLVFDTYKKGTVKDSERSRRYEY